MFFIHNSHHTVINVFEIFTEHIWSLGLLFVSRSDPYKTVVLTEWRGQQLLSFKLLLCIVCTYKSLLWLRFYVKASNGCKVHTSSIMQISFIMALSSLSVLKLPLNTHQPTTKVLRSFDTFLTNLFSSMAVLTLCKVILLMPAISGQKGWIVAPFITTAGKQFCCYFVSSISMDTIILNFHAVGNRKLEMSIQTFQYYNGLTTMSTLHSMYCSHYMLILLWWLWVLVLVAGSVNSFECTVWYVILYY